MLGKKEYKKFLRNEKITIEEAILAHCYYCNGEDDDDDCMCYDCPLYDFSPYMRKD